ncbi:unnamed protein product [Phytomonas sp. Hart1]|nr:unnamed protein product [Phytomonas sp. Hart1]|eukprot:CCW69469.1 unnamed protein product [Phytomonas sp. isolate Hart1]
MTKLVKKLKQMAKKRSHRKTVQKRKFERSQRQAEDAKRKPNDPFEMEGDLDMDRITQPHAALSMDQNGSASGAIDFQNPQGPIPTSDSPSLGPKLLGGIVVEAPVRKRTKQLTRKQIKRKAKMVAHGEAVQHALEKKWSHKKMRVKLRAQIRNQDLHN